MSSLILPQQEVEVIPALPFTLPELEVSEVESLLKDHPEAARIFVERCAKGELNWEQFTPAERGLILHASLESQLKKPEEISVVHALRDADWLRTPPTPEEFVNDPRYLGAEMSKAIYAPWRRDLIYVLNPKNEIHEWILSGGIGVGKTRIAIIAQLYKLCVLTCLRNIPAYFALDSATTISFGLFSLSLEKAESAISEDFKKIIGQSPYFKNVFPLKKVRSVRRVLNNQNTSSRSQMEYEVVLPQNLQILMGSKVNHALSFAVVSAILDEMNFRGKKTIRNDEDEDSSEKLYSQVRYRITSRFERLGYVPGILCVISSKKTSSDFLESHMSKLDGRLTQKTGSWVAQNDPHTFISSYSQWDVKPDKFFDKNHKTFHVFIGSSQRSSRILKPEEVADFPEDSPNIMEVPESVRHHFEFDINSALRELAGISSAPQHLLIENPLVLKKMWNKDRISPFTEDEIYVGLKTPRSISTYIKSENFYFDAGFAVMPKNHPDMLRTMHVDLSKDGDATGIAMGGVSCIKEIVATNLLGQRIIRAYAPEFFIDFALSIKAPQGDQVDYQKIQQFINYLKSTGFRLHFITFDRFQCSIKNTLINTNRGLVPIEDIKIGDVVESKSGPNRVINLFSYGKQKTIKIITTDGDVFEGTENHKIEAAKNYKYTIKKCNPKHRKLNNISNQEKWRRKNSLGSFKEPIFNWYRLDELKVGDTLSMVKEPVSFNNRKNYFLKIDKKLCGYTPQSKQNILSDWTPPSEMTEDLAEFLGLIWGDGHIGKKSICLTITDHEIEYAKKVFLKLFKKESSYYKQPKNKNKLYGEIRLHSTWFVNWLTANGLIKPLIPKAILQSSRSVQAFFLRGLFATDGSVGKEDGKITFSTKHYDLAQQVRILLRTEFGLESCLTEYVRKYEGDYLLGVKQYIVSIRGDRNKFLEQIGFSYNTKQNLLVLHKNIKGRSLYTKVKNIEISENEVFDLQVENDSSYTANGFISHNSVGPMQMLIKDGFTVDNLSVDSTDIPYVMLRDAISNGNVSSYFNKELERELLNLVHDYTGARARVDHPRMNPDGTKGRKDVCFTGDTKIKLLDGRNRSFVELIEEFGENKPIYLYTMNEGKVSVGIGRNPRKTMTTDSLVKITLDNNETIKCTPDHPFMLRDGTYKKAKDLISGVSLMPLYTKISDDKNDMKGYELYYCPSDNKYHYTHRMVGKYKYPGKYTGNQYGDGIIHHIKSKLNNDPDKLLLMTSEEHRQLHKDLIIETRKNPIIEQKRINNLASYNNKKETKIAQGNRIKNMLLTWTEKMKIVHSEIGKKTGKINITKYNKSEQHKKTASQIGKITIWKAIEFIKIPLTIEKCIELRNNGFTNKQIAKKYNCSISVVERRFMKAKKLNMEVPLSPYFIRNHKVVKIEWLQETQDVYDITVEDTHNFALATGVFVHNSDAVAGVIANSVAMLTDIKKHPMTANADMAAKILGALFRHQPDFGGKEFYPATETEMIANAINDFNPFVVK